MDLYVQLQHKEELIAPKILEALEEDDVIKAEVLQAEEQYQQQRPRSRITYTQSLDETQELLHLLPSITWTMTAELQGCLS